MLTSLAVEAASGRTRAGRVGTVSAVADQDSTLVARLVAGDDDAVGELFDRYSGFVLGLARRVARNRDIAEEVVQEVFASIWANPRRFDPARGSMRAYLGVLTYRRAVDAVRSDVRRRAREERCASSELSHVTADATDAASLSDMVRAAIALLPDEQRLAVELAFFKGHTYREVAVVLGIPEGTAKSRLRLAQSKLGTLLAPLREEYV